MEKSVVIFESKYGSTRRYAEWVSEELSCALFNKKALKTQELNNYETIIYGGGLYAGGVSGITLLTKNFNAIKNKNIILFTCGLANPYNKETREHIKESLKKVLTTEMQNKIKVFHFRGGIDYSKLGIIHKLLMGILYKMLSKKDYSILKEDEKQIIDTYGKAVNFTDKTTIKPLIEYVQK